MGALSVAMPTPTYAKSTINETPNSQLLASSSEEEMMAGLQMASRLSRKVGWPVFVSSSTSLMCNTENIHNNSECRRFISEKKCIAISQAEKVIRDIILTKKAATM